MAILSKERIGLHENAANKDEAIRKAGAMLVTSGCVLPEYVDAKGIQADAKDGVLRIHIPKAKTEKSQPLAIEVH